MTAAGKVPPCPPAGAEMERGTLTSGPRQPNWLEGGKGGECDELQARSETETGGRGET